MDGQIGEVRGNDMADQQPVSGRLKLSEPTQGQGGEVLTAKLVIDGAHGPLKPGMLALVTFKTPVSQLEPFRSLPTDPPTVETR